MMTYIVFRMKTPLNRMYWQGVVDVGGGAYIVASKLNAPPEVYSGAFA